MNAKASSAGLSEKIQEGIGIRLINLALGLSKEGNLNFEELSDFKSF